MADYKNILKVERLDDGTMNIFMKSGMTAYVEFRKLETAFKTSIYRLRKGDLPSGKSLIREFTQGAELQECMREAIGWIDENPFIVNPAEEIKDVRLK